jgi:hypothetical protein
MLCRRNTPVRNAPERIARVWTPQLCGNPANPVTDEGTVGAIEFLENIWCDFHSDFHP